MVKALCSQPHLFEEVFSFSSGPGTKLEKRLRLGQTGINPLDNACMHHDIAYSNNKDLKERHEADKSLMTAALLRTHAPDSSTAEKIAALAVSGAMAAKVKMGMGLNISTQKELLQCLEGLRSDVENFANKIKLCLSNLQTPSHKPIKTIRKKKTRVNRKLKNKIKRKNRLESDSE